MINKLKNLNFYFYITFFIIFGVITYLFCINNGKTISMDGAEYYRYFTTLFIDNKFDGDIYKYPMGTTLLQLPFLLITLFISTIFNIDIESGHSLLFQKTVLFSSGFYCVLGMFILYKIIKKFFSDKIASLTSLSLFFGTMLIVYSSYYAGYSHIYGFFTCVLFMWYTIFYEEKYNKTANKKLLDILFGIILALVCLVRYTNFIIVLLYIFYNVSNIKNIKERFKIVFSKKILYQFLAFFSIFSIQFILYKLYCGSFVLHGYENEKFIYLFNPQIYKVLFSINKGLFIYCPLLFLGFLAMFFSDFKNNKFKISLPLIFIILTYIVSSWWCWWLGYGYTERIYCDFLCIFALPIACIFDDIFKYFKKDIKNQIKATIILVFIVIFILLNLIWMQGFLSGKISVNLSSWYTLKTYLLHFFIK